MDDTILIRQMLTDDVPYVARFHHAAWMDAYRDLLPQKDMDRLTLRHFQNSWKEIMQDKDRTNLVAIEKAMPVGYASFTPYKKAGQWELIGIYVNPQSMNKGCGSALFSAVVDAIKEKQGNRLVVWVIAGNQRAINFYQKHGMSATGKTHEGAQAGLSFEEVQYELLFNKS
jgi:RimJ/RimL family protein N-acetyltransferase